MNADAVMDNIRNAFERSGMTLNELGEGLGYNGPTAKKRAWFSFISHVRPTNFDDPRRRPCAGDQNRRFGEVVTEAQSRDRLS